MTRGKVSEMSFVSCWFDCSWGGMNRARLRELTMCMPRVYYSLVARRGRVQNLSAEWWWRWNWCEIFEEKQSRWSEKDWEAREIGVIMMSRSHERRAKKREKAAPRNLCIVLLSLPSLDAADVNITSSDVSIPRWKRRKNSWVQRLRRNCWLCHVIPWKERVFV